MSVAANMHKPTASHRKISYAVGCRSPIPQELTRRRSTQWVWPPGPRETWRNNALESLAYALPEACDVQQQGVCHAMPEPWGLGFRVLGKTMQSEGYLTLRSVSSLNNPENIVTWNFMKIWNCHVENHHNYHRLHSE